MSPEKQFHTLPSANYGTPSGPWEPGTTDSARGFDPTSAKKRPVTPLESGQIRSRPRERDRAVVGRLDLSQAEEGQDREDDNNGADDVDDLVHG